MLALKAAGERDILGLGVGKTLELARQNSWQTRVSTSGWARRWNEASWNSETREVKQRFAGQEEWD